MKVEYKGKTHRFSDNHSFKKIQKIIESYPKKLPDKAKWWYRKSDFGVYFLIKIKNSALPLPEIDGKDWKFFRPIFKCYFPTLTEKRRALRNSQFLIGNLETPAEDYYFIKYILMEKFGGLTNKELENMKYKDAIMLYKYVVDSMITIRMTANYIQGNIIKKQEEQEEKQSGMTV